ncbi:Transcriptional regulatory protein DegU [subsurface metagenome]
MSTTSSKGNAIAKIRLLIADDHPLFREGLRLLLKEESDLEVVAVAEDGQEAVSLAREHSPNVVILDVAMPKLNGVEATKQIKAACPNTAIIALSAYGYESYMLSAIAAGATAYLLKTEDLGELVDAIRVVHAGQTVLDPIAANKLFSHLTGTSTPNGLHLHQRELEILRLGARGLRNKEIAAELTISERTVQTHFVNISRKLGVSSRIEAVLHTLREGLITLDDLP